MQQNDVEMRMKTSLMALAVASAVIALTVSGASARDCVTKNAVATSATTDQAKWFALETTVQAVSWGLWPGFVSTNKVEGYNVSDRYRCHPDGGQVTCHVTATFCKK
jgi:hypothetical protein